MVYKGNKILQRWGQTVEFYEGKIYIFGGRINSTTDDSELIEYDCLTGELMMLNTLGKIPVPRRRHASVLVGNCMLVFGGYNGRYFNDFAFLRLPKKK